MSETDEDLIHELAAERDRYRRALERLGSMEAFTVSRSMRAEADDELVARIEYARAALQTTKPTEVGLEVPDGQA